MKGKNKTKSRNKNKSVAYQNIHFIQLLAHYKRNPKQFYKIIKNCTNEEIKAISEIIFNFLRNNLKCDASKYKRHAIFLRLVGDRNQSIKKRRKAILTKGAGVIIPLLSIAIPALVSMFSKS